MFRLLRTREERRVIDACRVSCPLQERDADLELCLECGWAAELDLEARVPVVRCRPPRKLLLIP